MSAVASLDGSRIQRIVELRRTFHAHPELAFEEVQTAAVTS